MKTTALTDLDELIQSVRNEISQSYIEEAVNAYRGRAYRSAIVSTWIAVIYDIVAKLQELANEEKYAAKLVSDIANYIKSKDIHSMSRFEYNILEQVKNEPFEFLTEHEFIDLERLKQDRHSCAHPAFISEDALFEPTPELVRVHIVHAINHLLRHRPVQGKAAIQKIFRDLKSDSFPSEKEKIFTFLYERYFDRTKDAFIRNLIIELIKILLKGDDSIKGRELKIVYILMAISEKYRGIFEETTKKHVNRLAETLNTYQLYSIFLILKADQTCWNRLNIALQRQLNEILQQLAMRNDFLDIALHYEIFSSVHNMMLESTILQLFEKLDERSQEIVILSNIDYPHAKFIEQAVELYVQSSIQVIAEDRGARLIVPLLRHLSPEQIQKILIVGIKGNDAIFLDASNTPEIVEQLFNKTIHHIENTKSAWKILINFLEATGEIEKYEAYLRIKERASSYNILREENNEIFNV